jgi:hypothetical protein
VSYFKIDRIQCFDCGLIRAFPAHIAWDEKRKVYACSDRKACAEEPPRAPNGQFVKVTVAEVKVTKKLVKAIERDLARLKSKETNRR